MPFRRSGGRVDGPRLAHSRVQRRSLGEIAWETTGRSRKNEDSTHAAGPGHHPRTGRRPRLRRAVLQHHPARQPVRGAHPVRPRRPDDEHARPHQLPGAPTEFGWLLPVPPDVETELGSEQLFAALDQQAAPIFNLVQDFDESCIQARGVPGNAAFGGAEDDASSPEPAPPSVQVLSREAIGPYDRVILDADNVMVLRDWLDTEGFAIPAEVDAT
ncbi:MAG: DUF2330 domain-containing protein [bacterium]